MNIDLRGIAYYYESVGLALQRTLLVPLTITNWNNGTNTKMILKKYMPMATPWSALCPVSRQIQIRMSAKISEHEKHKYTFACGCFVVGLPPSLLTARSNDPQPNYFPGEGRNWNKTQMKTKSKATFIMLRLVLTTDLTLDSYHLFRPARTSYSAG